MTKPEVSPLDSDWMNDLRRAFHDGHITSEEYFPEVKRRFYVETTIKILRAETERLSVPESKSLLRSIASPVLRVLRFE